MLELIIGAKGRGKTRKMVERANNENKLTSGSIVYIDKNNKHMYELSNSIRLINLQEYNITSKEAFVGFVKGFISSNHSLTHMFLDNFMSLACVDESELEGVLDEMNAISEQHDVIFVISTAVEETSVPSQYTNAIICRL